MKKKPRSDQLSALTFYRPFHARLDAAVAAAYGWPADLPDGSILERLLALNLERSGG